MAEQGSTLCGHNLRRHRLAAFVSNNNNNNGNFISVFECTIVNHATYRQVQMLLEIGLLKRKKQKQKQKLKNKTKQKPKKKNIYIYIKIALIIIIIIIIIINFCFLAVERNF